MERVFERYVDSPRKFELLPLIIDFYSNLQPATNAVTYLTDAGGRRPIQSNSIECVQFATDRLQERETQWDQDFISQEVLDCLYNRIKMDFDLFMKDLQDSVRYFDRIQSRKRKLGRIMLFRMSEEPFKFLRFQNQAAIRERNLLVNNNIFASAFSNLESPPEEEVNVSESEDDEVSSERQLCYLVNEHVYGYLFAVLRADPCIILRLFSADAFLGSSRMFEPPEQVDFVLELFPLDSLSRTCLVFYSKLVRLFLEALFMRQKKDFFELLMSLTFTATSSQNFLRQVWGLRGRPRLTEDRPRIFVFELIRELFSRDFSISKLYFVLFQDIKNTIKTWQLSSGAKHRSKGFVFLEQTGGLTSRRGQPQLAHQPVPRERQAPAQAQGPLLQDGEVLFGEREPVAGGGQRAAHPAPRVGASLPAAQVLLRLRAAVDAVFPAR